MPDNQHQHPWSKLAVWIRDNMTIITYMNGHHVLYHLFINYNIDFILCCRQNYWIFQVLLY